MSLCGERAPRAVVTDSQWRRRPTVCRRPGRRALHRPAALRLPPAAAGAPLSSRRAHPPRPVEFSASGRKNRLCSEPRIISARRTAPLRPLAAAGGATVKRAAFHSAARARRRRRRPTPLNITAASLLRFTLQTHYYLSSLTTQTFVNEKLF